MTSPYASAPATVTPFALIDGAAPEAPVIVWFRNDLRLADNPALEFAASTRRPIVALYIFDETTDGLRRLGGAAKWWLGCSLDSLGRTLAGVGAELTVFTGSAQTIIDALVKELKPAAVVWNRRYEAGEQRQDAAIKSTMKAAGIEARSFNSHLLNEPWEVSSKAGSPMKVFTPYWRAARERGEPAPPTPAPMSLTGLTLPASTHVQPVSIASLGLKPTAPDWAKEMAERWTPGEAGARESLSLFLESSVKGYGENRNRPDRRSTSRLSPHLRFGEISPRQIWHAARSASEAGRAPGSSYDMEKFLTEIGWREFSYHLLHQFPGLANTNFQRRFDDFPWAGGQTHLKAWQEGKTGYPIVDAGMRELWRTGWMHNRVRMIVGSFLVKHLLIDWRKGEDWFWDTLVDADPASNAASWQWVAGSGADAAPYFRIFAPVLQGEKFDPNGDYVRTYVPELAKLPKAFIHKPWLAPHPELVRAGITLGRDYPHPIVVHEDARKRALAAFKSMSAEAAE
jgi:deoxyribodipyrimidine photo-lyase